MIYWDTKQLLAQLNSRLPIFDNDRFCLTASESQSSCMDSRQYENFGMQMD